MTSENKQLLIKAVTGLSAFAFTALFDADSGGLVAKAFQGLATEASGFSIDAMLSFVSNKWLNNPDKAVSNQVETSLVKAIHNALDLIEKEYLSLDGVSPRESQSLNDFFAILRDRSQQEFLDIARSELATCELIEFIFHRDATVTKLTDRLRIKLDPASDDFYFTGRFIDYFPNRFAELVQFHFKALLKNGKDAEYVVNQLLYESIQAGLNDIKKNEQAIRTLLDELLTKNSQTLQKVEFYGEIWISAIRKNRDQLDRIENKADSILGKLNSLETAIVDINITIQNVLSNPVKPGLQMSNQFQRLKQAAIKAKEEFEEERDDLERLRLIIGKSPEMHDSLKKNLDNAERKTLACSNRQQKTQKELADFLNDLAKTQDAIMGATSDRAAKAKELFEQGLFVEASNALNTNDLKKDKEAILYDQNRISKQAQELSKDFLLKAQLTILLKKENWSSLATKLFESAIELHKSYSNYFKLASFLADQNKHQLAIDIFKKALEYAMSDLNKSDTLNYIGNVYQQIDMLDKSQFSYEDALNICSQKIYKNDLNVQLTISLLYNNIGNIFSRKNQFKEASNNYKKSLEICRQVLKIDRSLVIEDFAMVLSNLGNLYSNISYFKDSEKYFREAISIRRELAISDPEKFHPVLALSLSNLGHSLTRAGKYNEAKIFLKDAVELFREIAKQNPSAYLPDLAMTLEYMANLYTNMGDYELAEKLYSEALPIYKQLSSSNPSAYIKDLAVILNNLGQFYVEIGEYKKADKNLNEALDHYLALSKTNPDVYNLSVADTALNIGVMYFKGVPYGNKEFSIGYAIYALHWLAPYIGQIPYASDLYNAAIDICSSWDVDINTELRKPLRRPKGRL